MKPIPTERRLKVRILPFDDETGTYNNTSEKIEAHASALLDSDFIQTVGHSERTNTYFLVTNQNPFITSSGNDNPTPSFSIKGEVERCTYEPSNDIDKRIAAYHFLGLWSLFHSDARDLCGYFQCRIKVYETNGKLYDSSVVVGASCGDMLKHSRKELIDKAIIQAGYNMVKYLFDDVVRRDNMQLGDRREAISVEEARRIASGYRLRTNEE